MPRKSCNEINHPNPKHSINTSTQESIEQRKWNIHRHTLSAFCFSHINMSECCSKLCVSSMRTHMRILRLFSGRQTQTQTHSKNMKFMNPSHTDTFNVSKCIHFSNFDHVSFLKKFCVSFCICLNSSSHWFLAQFVQTLWNSSKFVLQIKGSCF